MAKQQKKKIINITKPWLIIGVTSLVLNAIVIIFCTIGAVLYSYGQLDYAIANTGIDMLCSSKFRNSVGANSVAEGFNVDRQKLDLAFLDYQCGNDGAQIYYEQGFNNYKHSLGLKTE